MDRETLRQYRALCRRIECYKQERDTIISRQYPIFKGDATHGNNKISDPVVRTVEALERLQKKNAESIAELEREKEHIEAAIHELPHMEAELIQRHYCLGQTWSEVANAMGYSESHMWDLHKRALKKLARLENTIETANWRGF